MTTTKRSAVPAAALTAATALLLTGCGDDKSDGYDLKGTVTARHIDYDCKHVQGRAATAPLLAPGKSSGGTSGGGRSGSSGSRSSSSGGNRSGGGAHKAAPKPKKINPKKIPHGADVPPARPCADKDYELYVQNADGTFEQEVPAEHWKPCKENARFPRCTTKTK